MGKINSSPGLPQASESAATISPALVVETSRFGNVTINRDRVINFQDDGGLLGFQHLKHWALLQDLRLGDFFWLQSIDDPTTAFLVADPSTLKPEITIPISAADMRSLGIDNLDKSAQIFVICNKDDGVITGNFQGPIIINTDTREAAQLVLHDKGLNLREPLLVTELR